MPEGSTICPRDKKRPRDEHKPPRREKPPEGQETEKSMAESYTYRGYVIRSTALPTLATQSLGWNIYDGESLVKAVFASLDMAKHYIDVVLVGRDTH